MIRRLLTSLLPMLVCCTVLAQDNINFLFKHLNTANGLTGNMVTCFKKDANGFMWIGTPAGLNRYDGYRIRSYTAQNGNINSLPDSYILEIHEDYEGYLWLKTSSGYVVMNPATGIFERNISQRLTGMGVNVGNDTDGIIIFVDKARNMWFAVPDKGVYYYKSRSKLQYFFKFSDTGHGLPEGQIVSLSDNGEGGVLACYRNGTIVNLNGEMQQVKAIYHDITRMKNAPQGTYRAVIDSRRNMWAYTPMESFLRVDSTKQWICGLQQILKHLGWEEPVAHDVLTGIAEDNTGLMWLATSRSGLFAVDAKYGRVLRHLTHTPDERRSLSGNNIQSVYIDDDGQLWVGTERRGVSRWYPSFFLFDSFEVGDVNGISIASDGTVWAATQDKGLISVNDGQITRIEGLIDKSMKSVLVGRDGSVWAGSPHYGLSRLHPDGSITNYEPATGTKGKLQNGAIEALAQDAHGNIWIGTLGGGLQCFNPKKGTFSHFDVASGKMPSNFVTCVNIRGNRLIAGTRAGIVEMNLSNNQSREITGTKTAEQRFTSNTITQVLLDSRGLIWVGTRDGLNIYNPSTDRMEIVTEGSLLVNNVIQGLAEDGNHNVWITTARGVNRMALHEDASEPIGFRLLPTFYAKNDGLLELEFNMSSIATSPKGIVYMGCSQGYSMRPSGGVMKQFAPTDTLTKSHFIGRKRTPVRVLFSSLNAAGHEVQAGESSGGRVIMDCDLNKCKTLNLPYSMRNFKMELCVSSFTLAKHPQYLFRVIGQSDKWKVADAVTHTLEVQYLHPGKYRLEVKAVADGSTLLTDVHSIEIIVGYPWWLSWWTALLLLLLVAGTIYLIRRFLPRLKRYVTRRREAIAKLREKEATVDALAQNLRQQVSAMIPAISRLRESVADPDGMEELSNLQHSAKVMMGQLNEMRIGVATYLDQQEADILVDDDTEVDIDPAMYRAAMQDASGNSTAANMVATAEGRLVTAKTKQRCVLILEPDADMAEFIDDCLKSRYNLHTFTTVQDTEMALESMHPDVVVLSHSLPDNAEGGSRLCDTIKNTKATQNVQVMIAVEGVANAREMKRSHITLMADDYVPKPFNLQTLSWRIDMLCGETAGQAPVDETMTASDAMCTAANEQLRSQVDGYVQENISRTDLSIEEMSRVLNVPRTQLFRRVQRITGLAPADYIRHLRLVEAAKLLSGGYLSPAEVSQAVGFPNLTMFTRFFKDEYGVPPSIYTGQ